MNLIYYVIGGHPDYVRLLECSLETVKNHAKCDILVMCDASYVPYISSLPINYIHVTPDNIDHIHASMRKTEIFKFKHIDMYDKVLYLDCDVIIDGPLDNVFHTITNPNKLYVVSDRFQFTSQYFSCLDQPYTKDELAMFDKNGLRAFNAGQFGFCTSNQMREHFQKVCDLKESYDSRYHFYEQSFMNFHFAKVNALCYDLGQFVSLYAPNNDRRIINHFCNAALPMQTKLQHMKSYCKNS